MEEIQKYECMNAYTINFARITKISWYGWIARKKKGEKFQVTPDEAENKYNYSRNSLPLPSFIPSCGKII